MSTKMNMFHNIFKNVITALTCRKKGNMIALAHIKGKAVIRYNIQSNKYHILWNNNVMHNKYCNKQSLVDFL